MENTTENTTDANSIINGYVIDTFPEQLGRLILMPAHIVLFVISVLGLFSNVLSIAATLNTPQWPSFETHSKPRGVRLLHCSLQYSPYRFTSHRFICRTWDVLCCFQWSVLQLCFISLSPKFTGHGNRSLYCRHQPTTLSRNNVKFSYQRDYPSHLDHQCCLWLH